MLNDSGRMVAACWSQLPHHFPNVTLDAFVVMPNHVHSIIRLGKGEASADHRAESSGPFPADASPLRPIGTQPGSLGAIVQNLKSLTTRKINQRRGTPGLPVWQRNYYEHIIRDDAALDRIRQYIAENPLRWATDDENLQRER